MSGIFNRDRNFKMGIATYETIRFLTPLAISKIQRSCDVTVIWSFQAGIETNICWA